MKLGQAAAIPYRRNSTRELEVLLVTSRRKARWVLPKGRIVRMLPHAAEAREAFEEAGVLGVISRRPVGTYFQRKMQSGKEVEIAISAFPLFVNTLLRTWPEMAIRKRKWMHVIEAAEAVNDDNLRSILQLFGTTYHRRDPLD